MPLNIHATCVLLSRAGQAFNAPRDAGILLLGESGAGKSDLALRMIAAGAELVADDRVDLSVEADALIARAPRNLAGIIEIRHVGIVTLPHAASAAIALAVLLGTAENLPRLPEHERYDPGAGFAGVSHPPLIRLNAFEPSAPAKIAAAAAAFAHALFRENLKPN
jgi:HPr kinase/phosphorylase